VENPLALALTETLQEYLPSRIQSTQSSLAGNARLIEDADLELAVIPANLAYAAYMEGRDAPPRPYGKLRGIAVLYTIPLHIVATEASGIRKLRDIRGKRIAVGARDSMTQATVKVTLEGLGMSLADIHAEWVNSDAAVEELRAGRVDAVFHRGNDPTSTVPKLLKVPGARFVPISRSETATIRLHYPFLRPISIPTGMYGNNPETETIGLDSLVVCRDDLPEGQVYWITRALFESLVGHTGWTRGFQHVDLSQIQATPIPLHPGAARYYRERELFQ
jgi:TRAP transporter TAXI family solute receptor